MKKTKTIMSILALVASIAAVVIFALVPVFELAVGASGTVDQALNNYIAAYSGRIDAFPGDIAAIFTNFDGNDPVSSIMKIVCVLALVAAIALFVIALVFIAKRKHTKSLGLLIPTFVVGFVATLCAVTAYIPDAFISKEGDSGSHHFPEVEEITLVISAVFAVMIIIFIIALVMFVVYAVKLPKDAKAAATVKDEKVVDTIEKIVEEETVKEVVKETVVAEKTAEAQAKVVRRILVHKSGKVVRVLNEHYYDVTTNLYVEPGLTEPTKPVETEQQHYEKIIKAASKPVAPVKKAEPAPAPAPVVKEVVEEPVAPKAKIERIPFAVRLRKADKSLKVAYNEIKSELLSYGLKSRISVSGDTFRLHTKTYAKIVVAGKGLKIYFALSPKAYKNSTFPIIDASDKVNHADTPLAFKVKSDLSVRRAKVLVADVSKKDGLVQGEVVAHDHAKEVK